MSREEREVYDNAAISSLPTAARRWLARSLPEGLAKPARGVRIEQSGAMEVRERWTAFEAVGLYGANPLTMDWKARLKMLPGVWIQAEDGHRQGVGWGGARLWGKLSMGSRTDPEVLKTQLVRNFAELAWMPALAIAEPRIEWSDAGESAFEISGESGGQSAMVRFELDDQDDVISAHSPARPYDIPEGYAEAPWRYDFSDHRDIDGVRIPAEAVATFEKPDGPWLYMRISVKSVLMNT